MNGQRENRFGQVRKGIGAMRCRALTASTGAPAQLRVADEILDELARYVANSPTSHLTAVWEGASSGLENAPEDATQPGAFPGTSGTSFDAVRSGDVAGSGLENRQTTCSPETDSWAWVDIEIGEESEAVLALGERLGFDPLTVRDAVDDLDYPKVDDFGDHLFVVLHGLIEEKGQVATVELDCFLRSGVLVTMHYGSLAGVDWLWDAVQQSADLCAGGSDALLARLADTVCRRFVPMVEELDRRVDELADLALVAEPSVLADLVAVRGDVAIMRRAMQPQREVFDELRRSPMLLLDPDAIRRFSDVFDLADRIVRSLDSSRFMLSETLESYRSAAAQQMTEVTKVLALYATIMMPLTLIVGFFGMNHENLPSLHTSWGWIAVTASMTVVTGFSVGMFIRIGWMRALPLRSATTTVGRGLASTLKAPIVVAGALYTAASRPLRRLPSARSAPSHGFDVDHTDRTDRTDHTPPG